MVCTCETFFFSTEVGLLKIQSCRDGVHSIHILPCGSTYDNEPVCNELDLKSKEVDYAKKMLLTWLRSYFASSNEFLAKPPPVCPSIFSSKGDFTVKVWKTLMNEIAFGKTVSYGQLAELSGNISASRAVGSAMKNNPVPLIIPCHRVIKSDGSIGHFSCGRNVKAWLLKHERAPFKM